LTGDVSVFILERVVLGVHTSEFLFKLSKAALFAFAEGTLSVGCASVFFIPFKAEMTTSLERIVRLTLSDSGFFVALFATTFSVVHPPALGMAGFVLVPGLLLHSSTQGLTRTFVTRREECPRHVR
jgi:hypothetical protein